MADINDHTSRAHALLSASSAHRWLMCPYSATVAQQYPATDTVFTREGTFAHEIAEHYAGGGSEESIPEDFIKRVTDQGFDVQEMKRHAESYRDYIQSLTDEHSIVMLEQRLDFSDWVPQGFGTADCIILSGDTMHVIDYKYGQGVPVSAVDNPQMMLYGLGAVHEYGFIYDVNEIVLHIFQPRINNVSVYKTTLGGVLFWADVVVVPSANKAASGVVELHAGEHCKFCPHAGKCSELTRHCLSCGVQSGKDPATLTPTEIAAILEVEPVITLWLKKLKEAALTDALNGADVPGYKVVEGRAGIRKWKNELDVAKALEAAGIAQEDYTTLKLLSPAELDKSLGKAKVAELLDGYIDRAPGSPTLVPESDKRKPYDRKAEAINDFKE